MMWKQIAWLGIVSGAMSLPAQAQLTGYECDSEGVDNMVCIWAPRDTASMSSAPSAPVISRPRAKITMLTEDVLIGLSTLEDQFSRNAVIEENAEAAGENASQGVAAFQAALKAQEQLRSVEVFLQSAPGSSESMMGVISKPGTK